MIDRTHRTAYERDMAERYVLMLEMQRIQRAHELARQARERRNAEIAAQARSNPYIRAIATKAEAFDE